MTTVRTAYAQEYRGRSCRLSFLAGDFLLHVYLSFERVGYPPNTIHLGF